MLQTRFGIEPRRRSERKVSMKRMDSLSFTDGYALSLIAQYPEDDWSTVTPDLSADAQKLAEAIIAPEHARGEVKSAAERLLKLAEKARSAQA
jgi:hypothetical protein